MSSYLDVFFPIQKLPEEKVNLGLKEWVSFPEVIIYSFSYYLVSWAFL